MPMLLLFLALATEIAPVRPDVAYQQTADHVGRAGRGNRLRFEEHHLLRPERCGAGGGGGGAGALARQSSRSEAGLARERGGGHCRCGARGQQYGPNTLRSWRSTIAARPGYPVPTSGPPAPGAWDSRQSRRMAGSAWWPRGSVRRTARRGCSWLTPRMRRDLVGKNPEPDGLRMLPSEAWQSPPTVR